MNRFRWLAFTWLAVLTLYTMLIQPGTYLFCTFDRPILVPGWADHIFNVWQNKPTEVPEGTKFIDCIATDNRPDTPHNQ